MKYKYALRQYLRRINKTNTCKKDWVSLSWALRKHLLLWGRTGQEWNAAAYEDRMQWLEEAGVGVTIRKRKS